MIFPAASALIWLGRLQAVEVARMPMLVHVPRVENL